MRYLSRSRLTCALMSLGIALTLACAHAPRAWADAAAGQKIFDANDCGSCHETSGPVDTVAVAERSKIKGPPLWFAGSKFQPAWLTAWLETPAPLYRVLFGTLTQGANEHAALSAADAGDVGSYLMSLIDPEVTSGAVEIKKLSKRKMFKGEALFAKKQVCFGCHQFPSRQGDIGGFTGPSLIGAGERLQGDWIDAFMKHPERYYPNGRMPVYGDRAFEPYSEKELKLLIQYIGNL